MLDRHQNTWRTKPALQCMMFSKCALQVIQFAFIITKAFHSINPSIANLHSEGKASAYGFPINMHSACTAHTMFAANVNASDTKLLAQKIGEQQMRFGITADLTTIESKGNFMLSITL